MLPSQVQLVLLPQLQALQELLDMLPRQVQLVLLPQLQARLVLQVLSEHRPQSQVPWELLAQPALLQMW
jgi:hypothetical protein